ncbi:6-phosphogluconate dehydrogenase [Niveispirillum lacus]|uniref:6-phosphogluconate dehydrogenase n=1 Tax=Niveispirillum lacus TaxID=1981099 RepID=A0A255Z5F4_9PROT|nr:NAD(P)-dependent oxidoreductase [Niveispirillum lacus]OYQ36661.1 6-phosphogluconate dehydrogenase [Niveispirillum lacus]
MKNEPHPLSGLALIGFGEAGRTFATAGAWHDATVYDLKTDQTGTAAAKYADYAAAGVQGRESAAAALAHRPLVLCLVTADQALAAAEACAPLLASGALWCDMNSVAPDTKRAAATFIEAAGGRYVDVAVMAPVDPAQLSVPLLVSGPHTDVAVTSLLALGFAKVRAVGATVGQASSIKMVRSVMVKGVEALTAEMLLAAARAGVVGEVLSSLGPEWEGRADYNLDRMLVHGLRRAAEMEEVVKTLQSLGVEPAMTLGTVTRQRRLGALVAGSPNGLNNKLNLLTRDGTEMS